MLLFCSNNHLLLYNKNNNNNYNNKGTGCPSLTLTCFLQYGCSLHHDHQAETGENTLLHTHRQTNKHTLSVLIDERNRKSSVASEKTSGRRKEAADGGTRRQWGRVKSEAAAVLVASEKGAKSTKAGEEPRGPFLFGFCVFEPQFLPLGVRVS